MKSLQENIALLVEKRPDDFQRHVYLNSDHFEMKTFHQDGTFYWQMLKISELSSDDCDEITKNLGFIIFADGHCDNGKWVYWGSGFSIKADKNPLTNELQFSTKLEALRHALNLVLEEVLNGK